MGRRRRPGTYPYDYTSADDARFADTGFGGTLRVLHGPGRGMGVTEGVECRVEVVASDGSLLDESHAGKLGKEHRLHGTAPGDRVVVGISASFAGEVCCSCGADSCVPVLDELTAECVVELTGDLEDVVRCGVGPGWGRVEATDRGDSDDGTPTACRWGAGVRIRGARRGTPGGPRTAPGA